MIFFVLAVEGTHQCIDGRQDDIFVLSYAPELVAVAVFDADICSCLGTGFCRKCVLRVSHEFLVEGVRCHLQCVADRVQTTVADCFEFVFFVIDPNLDLSDHAVV